MHPFYYPTTVVVVDDDSVFLRSFDFQFNDVFACRTFDRSKEALCSLAASQVLDAKPDDAVLRILQSAGERAQRSGDEVNPAERANFMTMLTHDSRFQQVSVIVADYDMPGMTGVQLCRALRPHPAKKILLTGKAGLDTAVAAFNEGVIDFFVTKQDPDLQNILPRKISSLQDDFFASTTTVARSFLLTGGFEFMSDTAFLEAFWNVSRDLDIVEYYVSSSPIGIALISDTGESHFMVIQDLDDVQSHAEIAATNGADAELCNLLSTCGLVALFPTESGYYEPSVSTSWRNCLLPAQRVQGEKVWLYSIVKGDPASSILPSGIKSFSDYMDRLGDTGNMLH